MTPADATESRRLHSLPPQEMGAGSAAVGGGHGWAVLLSYKQPLNILDVAFFVFVFKGFWIFIPNVTIICWRRDTILDLQMESLGFSYSH